MSEPARDWPADPENEELERLAEQLQGLPTLPEEALRRVHQKIQAEAERMPARPARRRLVPWSIAAAVFLTLAVGAGVQIRNGMRMIPPGAKVDNPPPLLVEDRIKVALGDAGVPLNTEKSLVHLDDYRSLFAD